jgi:hypothetical protein
MGCNFRCRGSANKNHQGWSPVLQGNVPPSKDVARLVDEAYETLPPGPWRVKVRPDSAGYQQKCLDRWHNRGCEFAVSADMSQGLKREFEKLGQAWCQRSLAKTTGNNS